MFICNSVCKPTLPRCGASLETDGPPYKSCSNIVEGTCEWGNEDEVDEKEMRKGPSWPLPLSLEIGGPAAKTLQSLHTRRSIPQLPSPAFSSIPNT